MQNDINLGARRVVALGIADPKRIAIFGLSYGGFAALAGAAFAPDLYAAAIDMSGPSDLVLLMESVTAHLPGARVLFIQSVGDPSTPEGKTRLEQQSPINAAKMIKAPLLIIQGALDPLSPKDQSDRIVTALRARNTPVTYLLAQDEGHVMGPGKGWAHPVNNLAVLAEVENFLAETMGTLQQRDISPEVRQRLKELTVPAN
jgi:dipeptidyl aminopeptidase/acylaminoacyl peptidase